MRIDTHQHYWIFDPVRDNWIDDRMEVIQKNFLPNDISQILKDNAVDGVVAVQADQSLNETEFLIELASVYKLIKGVVGWVDLRSEDIDIQLQKFKKYPIVKGFRHIIEAESDPEFLHKDDFLRGLSALTKEQYTYDLLIKPLHFQSTLKCVAYNKQQKFVLDHMAKPPIRDREFDDWALFIEELSVNQNVYCKLSGLLTEADWSSWEIKDFSRYIVHILKSFGADRLMFGSDWPVSLLAGTYEDTLSVVKDNLAGLSEKQLEGIFGGNATKFYSL